MRAKRIVCFSSSWAPSKRRVAVLRSWAKKGDLYAASPLVGARVSHVRVPDAVQRERAPRDRIEICACALARASGAPLIRGRQTESVAIPRLQRSAGRLLCSIGMLRPRCAARGTR